MYFPLTEKQQSWADHVLSSLTMEEKVLQLLHPNDRKWSASDWIEFLEKYPVGSAFAPERPLAEMKYVNRTIQKHSKIPLLISANMENGTNIIPTAGYERLENLCREIRITLIASIKTAKGMENR